MPKTTIERIQKRIETSASISLEDRESLIALLKKLKEEVGTLPDGESARTVTAYAEISAREATQGETNVGLLEHALKGLRRSTDRFRENHPRLTSLVDDLALALSRLG